MRTDHLLIVLLATGLVAHATPAQAVPAQPIPAVRVTASSEGTPADRATDGKSYRPWLSAPRTGPSEWIELGFDGTRYVTAIKLFPGHAGDNNTFREHARPARVLITYDGGEERFDLPDKRGSQMLNLRALARTRTLRVTIEQLHGKATRGVAIAELTALEPRDILGLDPQLRTRIEAALTDLAIPDRAKQASAQLVRFGRPTVPWLLDRVRQGAPGWRPALDALLQLGGSEALAVVTDLVAQQEAPTRRDEALRALASHPIPGLEDLALTAARSAGGAADSALVYLTARHHEPALALVVAAAEHGRHAVIQAASEHLAGFGTPGREVIVRWSGDRNAGLREAAVMALAGLRVLDEPARQQLRKALTDSAEGVQLAAIQAVRQAAFLADSELAEAANLGSRAVREAAIAALVARGPAAREAFERILHGRRHVAAREALVALGKTPSQSARALLVDEVLSKTRHPWYDDALAALAAHGEAGARALLGRITAKPETAGDAEAYLKSAAPIAADLAGKVLASLGPDRHLDELKLALLKTLARARAAAHASAVIAVVDDGGTSKRVRTAALETLGSLPGATSRDALFARLDKLDSALAAVALRSSARLGDRRLLPRLLTELRDQRPEHWSPGAVDAIALLSARDAVDIFSSGFPLAPYRTRLAILDACKKIGSKAAMKLLVDASVSREPAIARAARKLLSGG